MSSRILVTGGAGYVGANCCKAFAAKGWEVTVFDNLSFGRSEFVRWGPLIEGDILDREALERAFASVRPHAVAHFAALSSAEGSIGEPGRYYRTNAVGTLNVMEAMRVAGVPHLLFSSSGEIYGEDPDSPVTENSPLCPVNPLGWSTYFSERVIADLGTAHGINSVILRYFNAAGADIDEMIGDPRHPGRHLIARAITAADRRKTYQVAIAGLNHATPDGTSVRDYIHVKDVASAHAAALEYLVRGGATQVLNLGSGRGCSARQIIDAVDFAAGHDVRFNISLKPGTEPSILVADPTRARAILSWRTRFSELDQIVRDAFRWYEAEAWLRTTPKQ